MQVETSIEDYDKVQESSIEYAAICLNIESNPTALITLQPSTNTTLQFQELFFKSDTKDDAMLQYNLRYILFVYEILLLC